ncbi:MAG: hypothetical protein P9X22_03275 [Candidatus Zapsychrus exili]|nr:hypothetical protein [Candidatus Zapsychrus exili]
MRKILFLLVISICFSSCAKLKHINELLTLKGYSDEQTKIGKYVESQDSKFDKLLLDIKNGALDKNIKSKSVVRIYGDPVFKKDIDDKGEKQQKWLYRYTTKYFNTDKVYLYFNENDRLVSWEYLPAKEEIKEAIEEDEEVQGEVVDEPDKG